MLHCNNAEWKGLHQTRERNLLSPELAYLGVWLQKPHCNICKLRAFRYTSLISLPTPVQITCISELPSKAQAFLYELIDNSPKARKDSPSFPKSVSGPSHTWTFAICFHSNSNSGGKLVLWGISGRGQWVLLHSREKLEPRM